MFRHLTIWTERLPERPFPLATRREQAWLSELKFFS